jgi:hypothetical protein
MALTKGHKTVLGVVLLVGAIVVFWMQNGPAGDGIHDGIHLVCVESGKKYVIPRDKVGPPPCVNPDTGKKSLVPYVEKDGELYVSSRYRNCLKGLEEINHHVDMETLLVTPAQ